MKQQTDTMDRRSFLAAGALTTAGLVAAGLTGCATSAPGDGDAQAPSPNGEAPSEDLPQPATGGSQTWSFEVAPAPVNDADITDTYTADIIIVGSGIAGLCTAVSAAEMGADVLLFSAGTMPLARGGSIHGFNSKYQREMGVTYTPESHRQKIKAEQALQSFQVDFKKWAKWINHSSDFIDWMIDVMNKKGLKPCLELGYEDPDQFLDCPPAAHNFWKEGVTWPAFEGAPLIAQAYADTFTEDYGKEIHYGTVAKYLIREGGNSGRVNGVVAQTNEGNYVKYQANKAVVLATGDFTRDREMLAAHCPLMLDLIEEGADEVDYDTGFAIGGLMPGDGQKMGLWAGAAWQRVDPVCPMVSGGCGGPYHLPENSMEGLNLDINGERFMNEITPFSMAVRAMINLPQRFEISVWDAAYAQAHEEWAPTSVFQNVVGAKPATPEEMIAQWDAEAEDGTLLKADTLDELLDMMEQQHGVNRENAKATIERYNSYAAAGLDEEFHKDPSRLFPIATPPFYAQTGSIMPQTVLGGLRTNASMQVCDENDVPLEGLYNIGSMVGDMYSGIYTFTFAGQNLGSTCGALAWLLGKDLAAL